MGGIGRARVGSLRVLDRSIGGLGAWPWAVTPLVESPWGQECQAQQPLQRWTAAARPRRSDLSLQLRAMQGSLLFWANRTRSIRCAMSAALLFAAIRVCGRCSSWRRGTYIRGG